VNTCEIFLKLWKEAAKNKIFMVPREKNIQGIQLLGLTIELAEEVLLSLEAKDYYRGPEKDHNPGKQGEVWIFRKNLEDNRTVYIKIKLIKTETNGCIR
jgi:hypothetical protein